jgi:hypothetical protein
MTGRFWRRSGWRGRWQSGDAFRVRRGTTLSTHDGRCDTIVAMKDGAHILVVTVVALAYWFAVSAATGHAEPWDAPGYLTFHYPLSLGLALIFGALFDRGAWRWGVIVIFAQLVVMLVWGGVGPLIVVGLAILAGLSIPAAFLAEVAARVRRRFA